MAPTAAAKTTDLRKQLFPSSSPASINVGDGKISDYMGKNRTSPHKASKLTGRTDPLQNRAMNTTFPSHGVNGARFASIFNQSDSFQEATEVSRRDDGNPTLKQAEFEAVEAAVDFDLDDFSDDDALDFEAPCTLPQAPLPSRSQSGQPKPPAANQRVDNVDASESSLLSWSQSSPSHFKKPETRVTAPARAPSKRPSHENDARAPAAAKKMRRQLPWPKKEESVRAAGGSESKMSKGAYWDSTFSSIEAKKKLHKTQQKNQASAKTVTQPGEGASPMKSRHSKMEAIHLSMEQRHVKDLVVEKGQSVFFTGPAGTGKSVLMRAIIRELKNKNVKDPERVAVTASTGLAACNIGGMTLHSFSGIGLGKEDAPTLVKKIRRNPKAKNRWLKTKILVVDEISMVDGDLFDKLSQIGRTIRNNGRPWGGIQLVITGDFFQLPPVPDGSKQSKFSFDAATWSTSIDHTIGLTEVFRQKDPEFAQMLNEMRLGRISEQTVQRFRSLSRELHFDDDLEVTELFPTRSEVEASNQRRLKALPGQTYRYDAFDTGDVTIRDKLLANVIAPPTVELRKGAQVMLIKNLDETLVNGSLGKVVDFMDESTFECTSKEEDGHETESDAMKRKKALLGALSDARNMKADNRKYPLVRFHAVDGTSRDLLCVPEDWKVELPTGEVQASRKQLPLILAWALSIHKAQGQTLERVKVDLGKVFEKGQAYVALSRATTQQGLQVLRFQKDKVMAHPRVISFYNNLYSAETAVQKKATGSIASFTHKPVPAAAEHKSSMNHEEDEEAMAAAYG